MRCPGKAAASIGRQDRLQGRCDNSETGLTVATVVALSIIIWDARCACDQSSHKDHKLGYVDNCWGGGGAGAESSKPIHAGLGYSSQAHDRHARTGGAPRHRNIIIPSSLQAGTRQGGRQYVMNPSGTRGHTIPRQHREAPRVDSGRSCIVDE